MERPGYNEYQVRDRDGVKQRILNLTINVGRARLIRKCVGNERKVLLGHLYDHHVRDKWGLLDLSDVIIIIYSIQLDLGPLRP